MAFPGTVSAKVEISDTPGSGDFNGSDLGGVFVYDLSGKSVHTEPLGTAFNNIDVEYNFGQTAQFSGEFTGEFGGEPALDPTDPTNPGTTPPPAFFTLNTTDAPARTYTGTSANNTMNGTSLAEKFDGKGGRDSYNGSGGDDTYVIIETGDRIASDSGGQDTVEYWGSAGYTLPPNIEHVVAQGNSARTISGNAQSNIMYASSGTGTITFNGMTGNDNIRVGERNVIATGGDGNDIFRYTASAAGDGNEIRDFRLGQDLIDVSSALPAGTRVDPWSAGVLYLVNTGSNVRLLLDADGTSGTGAAIELVEIIGVQINAGINEAHIYTGL